jgi:hypothetical protein
MHLEIQIGKMWTLMFASFPQVMGLSSKNRITLMAEHRKLFGVTPISRIAS